MSPWKKKATSGEGGDFELPPGGTYPACLVALIDLGTHEATFGGKAVDRHKIAFVWELTGEFDSKGETFKVIKDFTWSLNSKGNLRPFLEGWLGRKFGDDEEIDILDFVDMKCMVNVAEGVSGNGKKFVDVTSANRPMRGLTVPDRTVDPIAWTFAGWDINKEPPIPDWVPRLFGRLVADDIKASKEWADLIPF